LFTIPFFRFRQIGDLFFAKVDWILTAALLLLIVIGILLTKQFPERARSNIWAPLLLFLFVNLLTSLFSPYPQDAVNGLIVLGQGLVFIAICALMLDDRGLERILPWVLGISVSLNAAMALMGYALHVPLFVDEETGRYFGGTVGANNMALMSVFCVPIIVNQLAYAQTRAMRFLAALLLLLVLAGLVVSESRGGFVTFIFVSLLLAWSFRMHLRPHHLGILIAAGGIALLFTLVSVPDDYWQRQSTLQMLGLAATESTDHLRDDAALDRRAAYLVVAGEAFTEKPILGHGTSAFAEIWFRSTVSDAFKDERRPAHNTYAEVLVGSGLVGLLLFIALLWVAFQNYWRAEQYLVAIDDTRGRHLCSSYRLAFLSIIAYLFLKSGIDHKLFLLSLPLSMATLRYAQRRYLSATEPVSDQEASIRSGHVSPLSAYQS
jgi:O-antigen ligase